MDVTTQTVQVESPSSITKTISWASLPVEIRQTILSLVCLRLSGTQGDGLGSPKVARVAAVCWEWQVFFETRTFRRLVLDPDSLSEFEAIVKRHDARLGYIRNLWLRVRLAKYECPYCEEPEDKATQYCNNMIFTTCIKSLLETLQLWDLAKHGTKGLDLMLSASSPSDSEHLFDQCEIKDDYPFHYAEDLDLKPGMVEFHRTNIAYPFGRFLHLGYATPLYREHVQRIRGTPLRLIPRGGGRGRFIRPYKGLPAVPMIKGLVMRQDYLTL